MTVDLRHIVAELPLPVAADAGQLEALALAVAIEDGCSVTLPDHLITVDHLRDPRSVEAIVRTLLGGA